MGKSYEIINTKVNSEKAIEVNLMLEFCFMLLLYGPELNLSAGVNLPRVIYCVCPILLGEHSPLCCPAVGFPSLAFLHHASWY